MDSIYLAKQAQFHGINKLAHKKYRPYWAIVLLILFGSALSILQITVQRYYENPTYLSVDENYRLQMEFPSILLCPEVNFPDHKMDAFLDELEFPKDINRTYVRSILRQLSAFYSPVVHFNITDLEMIERLLDFNDVDLEQATKQMTTSCGEALIRCRYRGQILDCAQLFQMEVGPTSYCCVFNARSLRRELKLYGHLLQPPNNRYTKSIGYKNGMILAVNQSCFLADLDLTYKWLIIGGPQRFMDILYSNGTALAPNIELLVGYRVKGVSASEMINILSPGLRRCRQGSEKLNWFPEYRKLYCQLECMMAEVWRRCKCLMFVHPFPPGTAQCKAKSLSCAKLASLQTDFSKCNCVSTCDIETDNVIAHNYHLRPFEVTPIDSFYEGLNYEEITVIRIFVDAREVYKNSRQAIFTYFDLFAQMGGIFSVFFGCSILSLVEILQLVCRCLRDCCLRGNEK